MLLSDILSHKEKTPKNNGVPIAPFGNKNKNKVLIKSFGRFLSQLITLDQHLLLWANKWEGYVK